MSTDYQERGRRVSRAMRRKVEAGGFAHKAPLGYVNRRDGHGTWIEPDPKVAPLVAEAFALAASSMPLRQVLATMGSRGLRSRQGRRIGVSSLWKVLTNPVYAGCTRRGGSCVRASHGPIVEREVWERAQARLEERRRRPQRAARVPLPARSPAPQRGRRGP
jgi:hypothetical protein